MIERTTEQTMKHLEDQNHELVKRIQIVASSADNLEAHIRDEGLSSKVNKRQRSAIAACVLHAQAMFEILTDDDAEPHALFEPQHVPC